MRSYIWPLEGKFRWYPPKHSFQLRPKAAGTRPNKLTYTAAMSACEQGTVAIVDWIQKKTLAFWSESHSNLWIWKSFKSWNEFGLPYPSFSRRMLGWCFTAFGRDAWSRPDRLRGCSEQLRTTLGRSFASVAWYAAWRRAPGWLCWLGGGWCCQLTFWVSMLCGVNSPAGQKGCWVTSTLMLQ